MAVIACISISVEYQDAAPNVSTIRVDSSVQEEYVAKVA